MKLNSLNEEEKKIIEELLTKKQLRKKVELGWRIKYGWPALCGELIVGDLFNL
jgi:hypothetical protein